jgi:hypothetical protein
MATPHILPADSRAYPRVPEDAEEPPVQTEVDAATAREKAGTYLIRNVGDLLRPGEPRLSESRKRWVVPVILSNKRRGQIGEVGTISVDARTGTVRFSKEDRAKLKAKARELLTGPSA